jgi:hypothetical protein
MHVIKQRLSVKAFQEARNQFSRTLSFFPSNHPQSLYRPCAAFSIDKWTLGDLFNR